MRDHPRMRGEDTTLKKLEYPSIGSPPHARGRLKIDLPYMARAWITPACAGKTADPLSCIGRVEDHPRMRGEDVT